MFSSRRSWIGVYTLISELSNGNLPRAYSLDTDMPGLLCAGRCWPGHLVRDTRNRAPHAVAASPQDVPQPDEPQAEGNGAAGLDNRHQRRLRTKQRKRKTADDV